MATAKKIEKLTFGKVVLIIVAVLGFLFIKDSLKSKPGETESDCGVEVHQSYFDHSVPCVESFIKNNLLRDPDSYESIRWSLVDKNSDGTYQVTTSFRARNGFGGMDEQTFTFIISSNGNYVMRYN